MACAMVAKAVCGFRPLFELSPVEELTNRIPAIALRWQTFPEFRMAMRMAMNRLTPQREQTSKSTWRCPKVNPTRTPSHGCKRNSPCSTSTASSMIPLPAPDAQRYLRKPGNSARARAGSCCAQSIPRVHRRQRPATRKAYRRSGSPRVHTAQQVLIPRRKCLRL